MTTEDTPLV